MGVLQKEFDRVFAENTKREAIGVVVLRRALKRHNIVLQEERLTELSAKLIDGATTVTIPADGQAGGIVQLTADDCEEAFRSLGADISKAAEVSVLKVTQEIPKGILKSLYRDAAEMIREHYRIQRGFERRLYARWRQGLDRLKMLVVIAQESGAAHLDDSTQWCRQALREKKLGNKLKTFDAIVGLHIRACRIASEILCLLKGGFADGANARWRSLHEVATIALFLSQSKGDTANRYLRHAAVERFKAARQFQRYCSRLGEDPLKKSEMDELEQEYNRAISEFGADFKHDYAWAAQRLKKSKVTFADIEEAINLDHLRPYFKRACHSVHAGSQGLYFSLGSPNGQPYAGASNAGLCDPAHSTAISLTHVTAALLTFEPTLDGLVSCQVMLSLSDDIGEAFLAAHNQLEDEIKNEAIPAKTS